MEKKRYLGLCLIFGLLLCACSAENLTDNGITLPINDYSNIEIAIESTTATTTSDLSEIVPEEVETIAHTVLYSPEYTTQQILAYFEEVVLHTEYTDGTGDATLVQKWTEPIRYHIYGNSTQDDVSVLTAFFDQLNEIPGFPGIYAAKDGEQSNLTLNFLDSEGFDRQFYTFLNGESAYGAVQFWYYTDTNEIHTATIGYRTDVDQNIRTSVLIEEIVNMLGVSDSELRTDSIVYQYSNDNTELSDVDWVILKLLYDPAIQCGMDFDRCSEVIQKLYY